MPLETDPARGTAQYGWEGLSSEIVGDEEEVGGAEQKTQAGRAD